MIGCGALGSVAAEILARAGVGRIRIIDRDVVQWSNLQRQSLFTEADAQQAVAKADAAERHLSQINSDITIESVVTDLVPSNFDPQVGKVDLVIDAVDNFMLRFLLNDWSLHTATAWVHGGCVGASGQVRLFDGQGGPCFRCLVPTPPPASAVQTCDTAGVLGPATHAIAALQAVEAIKWLSGNHDAINTQVQSFDLWANRHREIELPPSIRNGCVACDQRQFDYLHGDAGAGMESAAVMCGRDSVQLSGNGPTDLSLIREKWTSMGEVNATKFFVRLTVDDYSLTVFRDGRILVDGTNDISRAKTIADQYIGS